MGRGGPLERGQTYREQHPETAPFTFEQLSERWGSEGKEIIVQHPILFARLYIGGIIRMLLRPGIQQLLEMVGLSDGGESLAGLRRNPALLLALVLAVIFLGLLYLGVLLALWFGWKTRSFTVEQLFIWGMALYILALSGGPSAFSRFRIPLIPLFAMLGAAGYSQWRSRRSSNCRAAA